MNKLKIAETLLLAVTALLAAVKSIIKFIGYIVKLKQKSEECGVQIYQM